MRTLVCGGHFYKDKNFVFNHLDATTGISLIITGASLPVNLGADNFAMEWARNKEIPFIGVPAQWTKYKDRAGPMRNNDMITFWDIERVIAFPGNQGTRHMVSIAQIARIPVEFAGW